MRASVLKGTGFSPYANTRNISWALAPEGMRPRQSQRTFDFFRSLLRQQAAHSNGIIVTDRLAEVPGYSRFDNDGVGVIANRG
jgi:hypothetical protein